jgi:outer membrane protein OmpA-like peptidoglycan-associated protein
MLMKIVTYVVITLLVVTLGAGAVFYLKIHQPMAEDYARIQNSLPELNKVRIDLAKYKAKEDKELKETAWINPAVDALYTGLGNEIKAGTAEVFAAGDKVVINISEQALYMPGSYTFTRESTQLLSTLVTLLRSKEVKGRDIIVGNTTQAVPAQGKGKKKIPAKDARTLAEDRSAALVKHLEKNGVDPDALIAAAYSSKQPAIGYKLKGQKIVIIIEKPAMLPPVVTKQDFIPAPQTPAKPTPETKNTVTASGTPQSQFKGVPIQQPKTH